MGGLTLFYFYFIVVLNLVLLAFQGYLWTPSKLRWFFAYLFGSGVLGLVLETDSTAGFVKSFAGIAICALYSAAFVRFMGFDVAGLFHRYAQLAFYSACVGLLLLPFESLSHDRLVGLFLEPSAFCIVCMPAVFYYADEWQRNRRYGVRLLTLCVAYVLTFSSLGYMGMLLGGLLFGVRYRVGRVFVPVVVAVVAVFAFQQSQMFQVRLNDTYIGLLEGDVTGINLSSLGLVANVFVTERQFEEYPLLGGGLGSHIVAHQRFIESVPGASDLPEDYRSLGEWDASSMLLRIISELGLLGLAGSLWFVWYYYPHGGTPQERAIALGLLCYVFMKFLRSGEYFGSEQFFFLSIYTVIGAKARIRVASALRARGRVLQPALTTPALPVNSFSAESHS